MFWVLRSFKVIKYDNYAVIRNIEYSSNSLVPNGYILGLSSFQFFFNISYPKYLKRTDVRSENCYIRTLSAILEFLNMPPAWAFGQPGQRLEW